MKKFFWQKISISALMIIFCLIPMSENVFADDVPSSIVEEDPPVVIPEQADFGSIDPILGNYEDISTGEDGLAGPINFANAIITFSTTIIGIWFLINIILQGIKIINNSKDPKAFNESMQKILWSIVGIALVALAYVIAGWVSAQLFGDTAAILNPSI